MLTPRKKSKVEPAIQYFKENPTAKLKDVAKMFGLHRQTLSPYLVELGLLEHRIGTRKLYTCDENFFENIDSEEKAYWLGFILADGTLRSKSENSKSIKIGLAAEDAEHLEKFKSHLKSDIPISSYYSKVKKLGGEYLTYEFVVSSKKMFEDLVRLDVMPNKTKREKLSPRVPVNLLHHYIRGIFDGDGWISSYQRNDYDRIRWEVGFGLGKVVTQQIADVLAKHASVSQKEAKAFSSVYRFRLLSKSDITAFIEYIYKDATVYLERKYEKSIEFCRLETRPQESPDN